MHGEARMSRQPGLHRRMFVGGVIVGDQMQVEPARCLTIDLLKET